MVIGFVMIDEQDEIFYVVEFFENVVDDDDVVFDEQLGNVELVKKLI